MERNEREAPSSGETRSPDFSFALANAIAEDIRHSDITYWECEICKKKIHITKMDCCSRNREMLDRIYEFDVNFDTLFRDVGMLWEEPKALYDDALTEAMNKVREYSDQLNENHEGGPASMSTQ